MVKIYTITIFVYTGFVVRKEKVYTSSKSSEFIYLTPVTYIIYSLKGHYAGLCFT